LTPSHECSPNITSSKQERLSLRSFKVLYLLSFGTSTICLLLSVIDNRQHQTANGGNVTPGDESVWKMVRLIRYLSIKNNPQRAPALADTDDSLWKKAAKLVRYFYINNQRSAPTLADTSRTNETH